MADEPILVDYLVSAEPSRVAERADALLLEQTVELPRSALRTRFASERLVGRVVGTRQVSPEGFRVTLEQPAEAAAGDPAQLLNVLFGNCSLQPDVSLEDVRLPAALARGLGGPRFGTEGLREATGVRGRALTASALKPMGLTVDEAASLCLTLARAGIDVIKDDHGLADHPFCPFAERVAACLGAVRRASDETGRAALYVPNLIGTPAAVDRQARWAADLGAQAVMVSPMLVGLPFLNELAGRLGLPIVAHPSFGGAGRIAPAALLGKLFRVMGADAVIFPNAGGRFAYTAEVCSAIAGNLRAPWPGVRPSLAAPAGGIRAENARVVLEAYGPDTLLLVGGGLLDAPDLATILGRGRRFVADVVHAQTPL